MVAVMQLLFEQRAAGELHWLLLCVITLLGRHRGGCIFVYLYLVVVVFCSFFFDACAVAVPAASFVAVVVAGTVAVLLLLLYCFSNLAFTSLHSG